jgi:hypothetical protein
LDGETWRIFAMRLHDLAPAAVILLALGLLVLHRRHRVRALACAGLYLSGWLIFTNLYRVHDYYQYATGLFGIGAVGFALLAVVDRPAPAARWTGLILVGLMSSWGALAYPGHFYHQVQVAGGSPRFAAVAAAIDRLTREDDVLLVYGLEWSSELPFAAGRRAIMDILDRELAAPEIARSLSGLEHPPAAVVICGDHRNDQAWVDAHTRPLGLSIRTEAADCAVYTLGPKL